MLETDACRRALPLWLDARGDALMPASEAFGPRELKPVLRQVGVFRRMPDGRRIVTVHGTGLVDDFGFDATGQEVRMLFPEAERDDLDAFHDFVFAGHHLSHSMRRFVTRRGDEFAVEQLILPVAGPGGAHDRYVLVAARSRDIVRPTPEADRRTLALGDLLSRTVYDPGTLLPVACPFTSPRDAAAMSVPLRAG